MNSDEQSRLDAVVAEWYEAARVLQLVDPNDERHALSAAYARGHAKEMLREHSLWLAKIAESRGCEHTALRRLSRLLESSLSEKALALGSPARDDWLAAALEVDQVAALVSSAAGGREDRPSLADDAEPKAESSHRETPELSLTNDDVRILRYLADRQGQTAIQIEVAEAIRRGRGTVGKRLKILRDAGLVARTRNERGGDAITELGLRRLSEVGAEH